MPQARRSPRRSTPSRLPSCLPISPASKSGGAPVAPAPSSSSGKRMSVTTGAFGSDIQAIAVRKAANAAIQDRAFYVLTLGCAVLVVVLLLGVMVSLLIGAWPALSTFGPAFVWTQRWSPVKEIFGALAPIYGTIITSLIAMIIGIPVSFGIAVFLTELCPPPLRRTIGVAIALLAD